MMEAARVVDRQIWRHAGLSSGGRSIPEETAVALTYNGGTYAVMMTTPQDLEDFAIGFSLSEGVISTPADLQPQVDTIVKSHDVQRMYISRRAYYGPTRAEADRKTHQRRAERHHH